ncbi:MAG: 50S ribosomal protein L22 [Pseudobdellovibrionaceae bacterium]|nr:50S ribosomal protein L22 [Bdellovibrionales bacterium]USN46270.1 MAG: 50S ribosomal protein L22 [Pseudobdellovibrionaceae bacterium]
MEVKANLRFARIGTQKARVVADAIRGKDVNEAIRVLTFMPKKTAVLMKKLLESAVANAEHRQVIDVDNLYVKMVTVDQGPSLKRFRPRAQGRASGVKKKMSHINLVLDER